MGKNLLQKVNTTFVPSDKHESLPADFIEFSGAIAENINPQNFIGATILPNYNHIDAFLFPKGNIFALKGSTCNYKEIINKKPPSISVLCKIKSRLDNNNNNNNNKKLTDDFFKKKFEKSNLNDIIDQYSENCMTFEKMIGEVNDNSEWSPELGRNGVIGIYKKLKSKRGDWDYYLFVHCDLEDLYKQIYLKTTPQNADLDQKNTIQNFYNSYHFTKYKELLKINACRLLFNIAENIEVDIEHEEDGKISSEFFPPKMAKPDFIQFQGDFKEIKDTQKKYIISYNSAASPVKCNNKQIPLQENHDIKETTKYQHHLVLLNPSEGFIILPIIKENIPSYLFQGLPYCLGRRSGKKILNPANHDDKIKIKAVNEKFKDVYVFEPLKKNNRVCERLNENGYNKLSTFIFNNFEKMGWNRNHGYDQFIPVKCKTSNDNVREIIK